MSVVKVPKLIGIAGYKQSGKDTAADYLVANHSYVRKSFAFALKELCSDFFDIDRSTFDDGILKEKNDVRYGMTAREILIAVGTGCLRNIYPNIWTDRVMQEVEQAEDNIVISDVRFQNEADRIRSEGGIIIRVVRHGYAKGGDVGDIDWGATPHYRLENYTTVADLESKLSRMVKIAGEHYAD